MAARRRDLAAFNALETTCGKVGHLGVSGFISSSLGSKFQLSVGHTAQSGHLRYSRPPIPPPLNFRRAKIRLGQRSTRQKSLAINPPPGPYDHRPDHDSASVCTEGGWPTSMGTVFSAASISGGTFVDAETQSRTSADGAQIVVPS